MTIGSAKTTPIIERMMVAKKVNISPCRTTRFAFFMSPVPLYRATRAVTPVFIAMNAVISRNFGWVVRPTAVTAAAPISGLADPPICPTIIRSTIDASWVRISSTRLGQAMRMMSL